MDARSLCLFRKCLALSILIDVVDRIRFLSEHYALGEVAAPVALLPFLLVVFASGCLLLGFRVKWSCFVAWCGLSLIYYLNPVVSNYGDAMLRNLVLLSALVPQPVAWSPPPSVCSSTSSCGARTTRHDWGTGPLVVQILMIHFSAGLWKYGEEWRPSLDGSTGSALQLIFNSDVYTRSCVNAWVFVFLPSSPLSDTQISILWSLSTRAGVLIEVLAPLLYAVSVLLLRFSISVGDWVRAIAWLSLVVLHALIAVFLDIGVFSAIALTSTIPLIPSMLWNAVTISPPILGSDEGRRERRRGRREKPTREQNEPANWRDLVLRGVVVYILAGSIISPLCSNGETEEGGWAVRMCSDASWVITEMPSLLPQQWAMFAPLPPSRNKVVLTLSPCSYSSEPRCRREMASLRDMRAPVDPHDDPWDNVSSSAISCLQNDVEVRIRAAEVDGIRSKAIFENLHHFLVDSSFSSRQNQVYLRTITHAICAEYRRHCRRIPLSTAFDGVNRDRKKTRDILLLEVMYEFYELKYVGLPPTLTGSRSVITDDRFDAIVCPSTLPSRWEV